MPNVGAPDTGDTAWMRASSALVLLMTPGLAFFYGGMVRSKSVLNMIMMSMSAMGVVGVLWVFSADGGSARVGGWIVNRLGAIDFAGGTAVHINAGAAALALCLVLGRRRGWPREAMRPHNLPLAMLGVGLLWFGWFGFNAESALYADGAAGLTGVLCALAVGLKFRFGFDDSLDVVGVHLVGGLAGTLAVGLFATRVAPASVDGLFYGGGMHQLWLQTVAAVAVMAFSFVGAVLIALVLKHTIGLRVGGDAERTGIDETEHAEAGYELSTIFAGSGPPHNGVAANGAAALPMGKVPASVGQEG